MLVSGLVSIGLPVFNGGGYIGQTVESLLAQDYQNLEIIISDNASTDDTESICRALAARDPRVRYIRQPQNMGMGWNWRFVSQQPTGEYFMWAAHDDQWSSNLVSALVRALEDEPEAVLAFPTNHFVNERNESVLDCSQLSNLAGPMPLLQRLNHVMWFEEGAQKGNLVHGLIRTEAVRRMGYPPLDTDAYHVWGGDQVIVFRLAFEGYFIYVPEASFYKRYFPSRRYDADDIVEQYHEMQGYFSRYRQIIDRSSLDERSRAVLLTSLAARETAWYCRVLNAKNMDELRHRTGELVEHCDSIRELASTHAEAPHSNAEPVIEVQSDQPLTSIIILNFNGAQHLQQCLESIQRFTTTPHEVIVFDNASTDGSQRYLRTLPNVKLVESPINLGCPPARTQALALAKGEYILFLDNDTYVTPRWLNMFLEHMSKDPQLGMLGPRSNYVSGGQLVKAANYTNSFELVQFAKYWTWRAQKQQTVIPVHRLVGFCMFARRKLIEKIGAPDPRFGKFGFEDEDYSLRALVSGFKIAIANDVFIHHTGGPQGKGDSEYNGQLLQAWDVFKRKWGIPAEQPYGQPYNVTKLISQPFDPEKHYVPIPPQSSVEHMVYDPVPVPKRLPTQDSVSTVVASPLSRSA